MAIFGLDKWQQNKKNTAQVSSLPGCVNNLIRRSNGQLHHVDCCGRIFPSGAKKYKLRRIVL